MNETSNIFALRQPDVIDDPLTNILRAGAQQILAQAVEIEVETFLATMKDLKLTDGRARVVRHGYGPARTIANGIGTVEVARAKIRDRGAVGDGERIRFSSAILPCGRGAAGARMRCCRCPTCGASRPAISIGRHQGHCANRRQPDHSQRRRTEARDRRC